MLKIGIDVGSTTMKTVALREDNSLVYSDYQRHRSQIIEKGKEMLSSMMESIGDEEAVISLSGRLLQYHSYRKYMRHELPQRLIFPIRIRLSSSVVRMQRFSS